MCVDLLDETQLSDGSLRSRLGLIGRSESRLAAMKSRVLAELGRRHSTAIAQRVAGEELRSSGREAKRDVETAQRMSELPATSDALDDGSIPQGHARLISRAAGEGDIDESALVEAAKSQDYDEFAKTVRRHQQDVSADDGQSILDRQRTRRKATIFESSETGMFVLSAQLDRITGTRLATVLTAKERELWQQEDPKARRTPQQRMADALAEVICEPGGNKAQGTNLLVIADFDVINQQLVNARLADGSPIPIKTLVDLALEAEILPSIFDAKTQNMWLGRHRRTASEAQRVALMARDQGCIGCNANPLWCKAHHILWWSKNGPTDLDNLLLVCDACHQKIHKLGWEVHQDPKTLRFGLRPPARANTKPESKNPESKRSPVPCSGDGGFTVRLAHGNVGRTKRALGSGSHADSAMSATKPTRPASETTFNAPSVLPSAFAGVAGEMIQRDRCLEDRAPPGRGRFEDVPESSLSPAQNNSGLELTSTRIGCVSHSAPHARWEGSVEVAKPDGGVGIPTRSRGRSYRQSRPMSACTPVWSEAQ
ncbi:MAG: DUF222 domain-containing protein [Acidimicrobiaceae bacterium]|nr:DUF222 domain-containing protein [Acidimicrobiaceae bacterium]MYG56369.1 DUF222 domain-containing protein [Acidimicrobiaceae bacterium]MYJ97621.1 DUF222 domain-containing protein [Acidimicrobiaceae bacterium]